jgi:hypothetical protein
MDGIQLNRSDRFDPRRILTSMEFVNVLVSEVNVLESDPIFIANCFLAIAIMGQSRPWSDRYLFSVFNASQQLSIRFNTLQHDSTLEELAVLKRVEHYPQLPSEPPLKGGRRVAAGGSCLILSEA